MLSFLSCRHPPRTLTHRRCTVGRRRSVEKPTLIANKISYLPGETILFSGGSWRSGEGVTIVIKSDAAGIVATVHGNADESGLLNISATMPKLSSFGSADAGGKNAPILTATAMGSSGNTSTRFTLGHAPTDAERLISEEEYWNHRLTYPTGRSRPPGRVRLPNRIVRSSAVCPLDARAWSRTSHSQVPTAPKH